MSMRVDRFDKRFVNITLAVSTIACWSFFSCSGWSVTVDRCFAATSRKAIVLRSYPVFWQVKKFKLPLFKGAGNLHKHKGTSAHASLFYDCLQLSKADPRRTIPKGFYITSWPVCACCQIPHFTKINPKGITYTSWLRPQVVSRLHVWAGYSLIWQHGLLT